MARAALVCGEPGCPSPAVRAGFCDRHQRRTVEGRARRRRYERLVRRDGRRCADCEATGVRLIQSHDRPLACGGPDADENVHLRCGRCHAEHDRAYGLGFGGTAVGGVQL
jgi:hypothetical protein